MIKHIINEIRSLLSFKGLTIILYGLPTALIIRIISKILLIRIMGVNAERIGELIINPAIYLYQKENKINSHGTRSWDIFFMKDKPINKQIFKMLKREINIYPKFFLEPVFEAQKKLNIYFKDLNKYLPIEQRKFKFHYIDKLPESKKNIKFLKKEIIRGERELLNKFGIHKKDKFICLLIRDQEFLKKIYPNLNFETHEYRNIDPLNFIDAAKILSKKGYYVFRMGKFQSKKFETSDPKIIDYANSDYRNDFLDIFLSAHCNFFLTTMSGLDNLLPIFNIPTIVIPLNLAIARQYKNYLISTKTFLDPNNKKVSLKELFEKNLIFRQKKEDFDNANIRPIDPSPDQLTKLVIEMDEHIINSKPYTKEENDLNNEFWRIYSHYYNKDKNANIEIKFNGQLKVSSRFDINFLKDNHNWFLK